MTKELTLIIALPAFLQRGNYGIYLFDKKWMEEFSKSFDVIHNDVELFIHFDLWSLKKMDKDWQ